MAMPDLRRALIVPTASILLLLALGCRGTEVVERPEEPPLPKEHVARIASTEFPWGEPHDGLQLRLLPDPARKSGRGAVAIHVRSADGIECSLELGLLGIRGMNFRWSVNGDEMIFKLGTAIFFEPIVIEGIGRELVVVDRMDLVALATRSAWPRSKLLYNPGTYEIRCEHGGMKSNAITLEVTEKTVGSE